MANRVESKSHFEILSAPRFTRLANPVVCAAAAVNVRATVIGEYWDNEQGYAAQVEAADEDDAIAAAQNQCLEGLNNEHDDDDQLEDEPLKIWAVLAGWPEVLYTHDV